MPDVESNYQKALDYLYSFVDYSLTRSFRYSPEKFDLGRMFRLMDRLGNPQNHYPTIHVAGTKGKGSVSALIASILKETGYRVGFYTSPHLQDFTERIQINGVPISHSNLVELVEELKPHADLIEQITTFELTTALAFLYFARQKVEVGVIEVGLGGRLDATNIITPLVSVITSLSLDHMNLLGDTLAKIAGEKAGIIKPGRPLVLAPQKEEARLVVENVAKERSSDLFQVGRDLLFASWGHSLENQTIMVWQSADQPKVDTFIESSGSSDWEPMRLTIPLLGYHQIENAATAYAALDIACHEGLKITDTDIEHGFAKVFWPGRFEVMRSSPPVIIDSAHNRDSALKLRLAIEDYLPGQPVILVFGASEDKDIYGMFAELLPRVIKVVATQSEHPRAMSADKLVELAHQFGCPSQAISPVECALAKALDLAGQECAVVVAGSLFVAAAAREAWPRLSQLSIVRKGIFMKDEWFPRQEGSEDYSNSLHQRTEELYRIPDGITDENGIFECPVLMLRDIVVFPRMVSPVFIAPSPNLLAIQDAQLNFQTMVALVQKDPELEDAQPEDFMLVGVEVAVGRLLNMPDGNNSALIQGRRRVEVFEFTQTEPFFQVKAKIVREPVEVDRQMDALMRTARDLFERCVQLDRSLPEEAHLFSLNITEPGWLADMIATAISLPFKERQTLLMLPDPQERLKRVNWLLAQELDVLQLEDEIQTRVQSEVDRSQREFYLREQMKAIQTELGEGDIWARELIELREKIEKIEMPTEAKACRV